MCGIIACISRRGKRVEKDLLIRAGSKMIHRGPDAQGIFIHNWIGMVHNRLSIIDLSCEANQPMFSEDKRYVIIYNGEIYNYKELRKELMSYNVKFRTRSDTEVLLNAYIRFSKDCLNKLRGMFAFVILDLYRREVFVARDPFGIKPMYIYKSNDYIILSSEIKAMSEFVQLEPNYNSYIEEIMFRDVSGRKTCFENIYKLIPGNFCLYTKDGNEFKEERYYSLDATFRNKTTLKNRGEEDIVSQAEDILTESIKVHTYSDVGYNLQLSGGVDSSLVAAILAKKINRPNLTSYSITLDDHERDESHYQNIVADNLGLKKCQMEMTNKIFTDNLERATYFIEKPIVHPGSVCLFYLTKQSVLDSKVILTGEGADEAFGGYTRYNIPFRLYLFKTLHDLGLHKVLYPLRDLSESLKRLYLKIRENQLLEYSSLYSWYELEKLVRRQHLANKDLSFREALLNEGTKRDTHAKLLFYDQLTYLPTLLDRQDKLSMANSVEARVPYTDIEVYKFLNSIPSSFKFKKSQFKYILRKIAERYLPKDLIYRKKNGLNLPIKRWFKEKRYLGKYLDMLLDDTAKKRSVYDMEYLKYMVKMQEADKKDFTVKLGMLINFELWHRIFFDRGSVNL